MAGKLMTGLLGYTMKKEFLGQSLFFRTTQTFDYEIYSYDLTGWSPTTVQNQITSEFQNKYSGNVYCTVFDVSAEPNTLFDGARIAKYRVSLDVKSTSSGINASQPELGTNYYTGLDAPFWNQWGIVLLDFKEDFSFEQQENGNQVYGHDLSFMLLTGTKMAAYQVASGIFNADKGTTFGITAMVGGAALADTSVYQDYYTEVFDQTKQTYHFNKRREVLADTGSASTYNLVHSLDLKEDGTCDINEHCNLKGKLTFEQTQTQMGVLLGGTFNRCNTFYTTYNTILGTANQLALINTPIKTTKFFNRQSLEAAYDVSYTTDPEFKTNGSSVEEIIDFQVNELSLVSATHAFNFLINERATTTDFVTLMNSASGASPTTMSNYYSQLGTLYSMVYPLNQIKYNLSWPNRNNKANITFEYSNHPKYFVVINGVQFNYLDFKVQNNKPADIVNEYKVINRPTKMSIVNYAYQTQKGQIDITVEGGLGRNPNEFLTGFRSNYGASLLALYKYGTTIFMNQFQNIVPVSFTYFLDDMKYNLNQDGILTLTLNFTYTLKKYLI